MWLLSSVSVLIIPFGLLVATSVVPAHDVTANTQTSEHFRLGQTLSAVGQSASFKIQCCCRRYVEFVTDTALALSGPDFRRTYPCLFSRAEVFYTNLPKTSGHHDLRIGKE